MADARVTIQGDAAGVGIAAGQAEMALGRVGNTAQRVNRQSRRLTQGVRSLGFILNDMQQFSFGAAQGMRAIGNNLGNLVMGFTGGGLFGVGLTLAVEAAASAFVLLSSRQKEAEAQTEKTAESFDRLRNSVDRALSGINVPGGGSGRLGRGDLESLIERIGVAAERERVAAEELSGFATDPLFLAQSEFILDNFESAERKAVGLLRLREQLRRQLEDLVAQEELLAQLQDLGLAGQDRFRFLARESFGGFEIGRGAQAAGFDFSGGVLGAGAGAPSEFDRRREQTEALANSSREAFRQVRFEIDETSRAQLDFQNMSIDMWAAIGSTVLDTAATVAGAWSGVFQQLGREGGAFFTVFKGLAIAEATVNTYVAATKALTAGPILGPLLMAGTIATGLAQVARIAATQPGGGGAGASGGGIAAGRALPVVGGSAVGIDRGRTDRSVVVPAQAFASTPRSERSMVGILTADGRDLKAVIRFADADEASVGVRG